MTDLLTLIAWRDSLPESERPGPTELWMLAVMATFTGGDATIVASFAEVATRYGCEDRNAKYLIAKLKKRGAVRVLGRQDQRNVYVLEAFVPVLQAPSAEPVDAKAEHAFTLDVALRASLDARELDGIVDVPAGPLNAGDGLLGFGSGIVVIDEVATLTPEQMAAIATSKNPMADHIVSFAAGRVAAAIAPPCMLCGEEPQVAGGGGSCATCTALEGM